MEKWITIECGGYRRTLPENKLPLAIQHAEELKELAMKSGKSKQQAEELYGLKIVKEE